MKNSTPSRPADALRIPTARAYDPPRITQVRAFLDVTGFSDSIPICNGDTVRYCEEFDVE